MKGTVFDIQRFSLHDGPGVRTTVFLKGCNLTCFWCQNPEGIHPEKDELQFFRSRCIECGDCFRVCPVGAHKIEDDRHILDRDLCTLCGKCVEACTSKALVMAGRELSSEEIVEQVAADKVFYDYSGGGVTLSGGDPLLQLDFSREILAGCKALGIQTAFESALNFSWSRVEKILPVTDLVMADIKHISSANHREGTGVANERILENLRKLSERGVPIILRIPVIPQFNDSIEVMKEIFSFVSKLRSVRYVELLEFHRLGEHKYHSLGRKVETATLPSVGKARMAEFVSLAKHAEIPVKALS
jgi:pyruvate formate lyase activating enzyme